MTCPTFLSKYLPDGSTSMICRETGETYLISKDDHCGDCYCYREGEFFTFGVRAVVVNSVESDAKWSLRVKQQHQLALQH